jgi:predicted RNA binding protein with dsRBD fold (UPF0201 family)
MLNAPMGEERTACKNAIAWLKDLKDRVQPRQEWSEEDDAKLKSILFHIEDVENKDVIDWLKSLKDRVQPQTKQEWSEDDEKVLHAIKNALNYEKPRNYIKSRDFEFTDILDWLKDIKDRVQPQSQWKPTRKQLMALRWVLNYIPYDIHKEEISGLLDQIKDL